MIRLSCSRRPFTPVPFVLTTLALAVSGLFCVAQSDDVFAHVPKVGPRTMVLADRQAAFRAYCTTGLGAEPFRKIKVDYDRDYAQFPFPEEPRTYGDPDPSVRDSDKADKWRAVQDT